MKKIAGRILSTIVSVSITASLVMATELPVHAENSSVAQSEAPTVGASLRAADDTEEGAETDRSDAGVTAYNDSDTEKASGDTTYTGDIVEAADESGGAPVVNIPDALDEPEVSSATESFPSEDEKITAPLDISKNIRLWIGGCDGNLGCDTNDNKPITVSKISDSLFTESGGLTDQESDLNGFKAAWVNSTDEQESGALQITLNAYVIAGDGVFAESDFENGEDNSEVNSDGSDTDVSDTARWEYLDQCSRQYDRFSVHWTVEEIGHDDAESNVHFKSGEVSPATSGKNAGGQASNYEIKSTNDLIINAAETSSEIRVNAVFYADGEVYHDGQGNLAADEFIVRILHPHGCGTTEVASFTITPDQENVKPGAIQQFTVHAVTKDGESIGSITVDDPISFHWDVSGTALGEDSCVLKQRLGKNDIPLPVGAETLARHTGTGISSLEDSANGSVGVLKIGKNEDAAELTVTATAMIPKDSGYIFPNQKDEGNYYTAKASATVFISDRADSIVLRDDRGDSAVQGRSFTVYYCDQAALDPGAEEETVYTTGKPITFSTEVVGFGPSYKNVEWRLEGSADKETVLTEHPVNRGQAVLTIGPEEAANNKNHKLIVTATAIAPNASGKILSTKAVVNLGNLVDMRFENADSHAVIGANSVQRVALGGILHVRTMVCTGSRNNGYAFNPNVTWTAFYTDKNGKPAGSDGKTAATAQSLMMADNLDSLENAAKTGGAESAYFVGSNHSIYLYINPEDRAFQRIRVMACSTEFMVSSEPAQASFDVMRSSSAVIRIDTDKSRQISSQTLSCGDEVNFYGFLNNAEDVNLDWDLSGEKSNNTYISAEGDKGRPISVRGSKRITLHVGTDEVASFLTIKVKDPYYSTARTLLVKISHYGRAYIVNEASHFFPGNTIQLSRGGTVILKTKLDGCVDDPMNTNALTADNRNNLDGKVAWTIAGNTDPTTKIVTGITGTDGTDETGENLYDRQENAFGMPGTITLQIGPKETAEKLTVTLACVTDPLTKPAVLTVSMNYTVDVVILNSTKKNFSDHSDENNNASTSLRTGESLKLYAGVNDSFHPKNRYKNGYISTNVIWALKGYDGNSTEIKSGSLKSILSIPSKDGSVTLFADPSDCIDHFVLTASAADTVGTEKVDSRNQTRRTFIYTLTVNVIHVEAISANQNTTRKAVYKNNSLTVQAGRAYAFRTYVTYADEKHTFRVASGSEATWSLLETAEDGTALPGADYSKHMVGDVTIQDTYIDESGVLHVAADEHSARIYIRVEAKDTKNAAAAVLIVKGPTKFAELSSISILPSQKVVNLSESGNSDIPLMLTTQAPFSNGTFGLTAGQMKATWSFERYDSRNRKITVSGKNLNPDITTGFISKKPPIDGKDGTEEDAEHTNAVPALQMMEGSRVTLRIDPKEVMAEKPGTFGSTSVNQGGYQTDHIVVTAVWKSLNSSRTVKKSTSVIYLGGDRGEIGSVVIRGQSTAIRGSSIQLTASVIAKKTGSHVNSDLTWQIEGRGAAAADKTSDEKDIASRTCIDENGFLTVGENEKANRIVVIATAADRNSDGSSAQGKMTISIKDRTVSSLAVRSLPVKTEFVEGQTLEAKDFSGLIITARYDDGTEKQLGYDAKIKTYDPSVFSQGTFSYSSRRGTQTITYTLQGKKTSFQIKFRAKMLKSIELFDPKNRLGTKENDKTYYTGKTDRQSGSRLDLTGVYLLAYYDNGKSDKIGVNSRMISPSIRPFTTADFNPRSKYYEKDETTGVIRDVMNYTVTYTSGSRKATAQFKVKIENNPVIRVDVTSNPDMIFQYANTVSASVSVGDTTLENAYGVSLTGDQIFRKMQLRVNLIYNDGSVLKDQRFSTSNWNVKAIKSGVASSESSSDGEACSVIRGATLNKDAYEFAMTAGAAGVFTLPVQYCNKGYTGINTDGNNNLIVECPIRLAAKTITADYGDHSRNTSINVFK